METTLAFFYEARTMVFFDVKPYVKKFNDLLVLRDLTCNTINSYNNGNCTRYRNCSPDFV